jgi:hypothetical protein
VKIDSERQRMIINDHERDSNRFISVLMHCVALIGLILYIGIRWHNQYLIVI